MPEPSSVRHEVGGHHPLAPVVDGQEVERPPVAAADQVGAREPLDDVGPLRRPGLGHHQVPRRRRRPRTRTYSMSGPTAAATLEISVHGVVVHTSRSDVADPTTGKRT